MATLVCVHAHPDDEAALTGGVVLRAKREGHRVVLVTCTGGEEGGGSGARLRELWSSCAILGVDHLELLGYRDSGLVRTPSDAHPSAFCRAPVAPAAERVARVLRAERPSVVVTYAANGTYGHPDHRRAHEVTLSALDVLGAEGWAPSRVCCHAFPASWLLELDGVEVSERAVRRLTLPDAEVAVLVDVADLRERKWQAFEAHVSQQLADPFASVLGRLIERGLTWEPFQLARGVMPAGRFHRSLMAGLA